MTYYSANHYAIKAEKSMNRAESAATRAETAAAQSEQATGKIVQLGFDGAMQDGLLVFTHAPSGVEVPYELLDDYEYEIDLSYNSLEDLSGDVQMYVKNGNDIVTFVSALHRDSSSYATVKEMSSVMRFDEDTGYRWLFKAAFKIAPNGTKVLLLYPVIAKVELPTGSVISFAANSTPNGYLICNGAAVSRTTYAELFAVIGTTYGTGDGSTTFNVPNLTDKFIQGSGTAGTVKSAGLPNITGSVSIHCPQDSYAGSFYNSGNTIKRLGGSQDFQDIRPLQINASRSSSIYGNSSTVQPPALTMRFYIKY